MAHRTVMWGNIVLCVGATIMGTLALAQGNVDLWLINCGLFVINAALAVFNLNRIT